MHISFDIADDTVNAKNDTVNGGFDTVFQKILELIAENDTVSANEISRIVGVSVSTVKRRLKVLKESGVIERIGSDKKGSWKIL